MEAHAAFPTRPTSGIEAALWATGNSNSWPRAGEVLGPRFTHISREFGQCGPSLPTRTRPSEIQRGLQGRCRPGPNDHARRLGGPVRSCHGRAELDSRRAQALPRFGTANTPFSAAMEVGPRPIWPRVQASLTRGPMGTCRRRYSTSD